MRTKTKLLGSIFLGLLVSCGGAVAAVNASSCSTTYTTTIYNNRVEKDSIAMATCSYSSKDSVDAGHWKVGFTYTYVFSGIGTYLGKRVHLGYEVNQTSDIALDCQINVKVNGSWVNNPSDYLDIGVFGNDTLTFKLKKDISNDSYISWASVSNATLQSYIQNDSTLVNLPWEYLSIGGVN